MKMVFSYNLLEKVNLKTHKINFYLARFSMLKVIKWCFGVEN